MNTFSRDYRSDILKKMSTQPFDLLVVGGGITGAGIALDAASRGLSVALAEMQDFASGTSGRSTKLIHGGLRYLKQLEFKLVAEVGKEREIIHRLAPHLTRPEPMLLPIIKNGSLGKISARLAMLVYEILAGVKRHEKHRMLDPDKALDMEPLLRKSDLLAGVLFYEYRTDDARLTMEVIKEAMKRGAIVLNYAKIKNFTYENKIINGGVLEDRVGGETIQIRAKYVVNASGPWVDETDDLDASPKSHKLNITKGVHLVVDHAKLPVKQSVYFEAGDGRMLFVIPREGKTYIGTTDTFYKGELVQPEITNEDKDYLLDCVNSYFSGIRLQAKDVESAWAGVRPLINKPGKKATEISRKDELFIYKSGLITIAGGKLTGYRKMAERVMQVIADKFKANEKKIIAPCHTHEIYLSGGAFDQDFHRFMEEKVKEGVLLGLSAAEAEKLAYRYGPNVKLIYETLQNLKEKKQSDVQLPLSLLAQLIYAVEQEMCLTLSDFFIRRTGMLYFDIASVKKYKMAVETELNRLLVGKTNLPRQADDELENALKGFNY